MGANRDTGHYDGSYTYEGSFSNVNIPESNFLPVSVVVGIVVLQDDAVRGDHRIVTNVYSEGMYGADNAIIANLNVSTYIDTSQPMKESP